MPRKKKIIGTVNGLTVSIQDEKYRKDAETLLKLLPALEDDWGDKVFEHVPWDDQTHEEEE